MDCKQFDSVLDRAPISQELPDDARLHLAECARCRVLYSWLSETPAAGVPAAIPNRLADSLRASLVPVKRLPAVPLGALRLLGACAVILAVLLAAMGTAGVARMTGPQLGIMTALLATGAVLLSSSLAAQMRPGSRTYTRSAAVSVLLAIGAVGGIFPWHVSPAFVAQGLPCLASGILVAVAGAVVLRILVRRGAPVSARSIRVTLGAAAGWLALITLQYKCPHQEAPHLLAWHGGVLLLSAAAGLAWAREPRFRRDSRAA